MTLIIHKTGNAVS